MQLSMLLSEILIQLKKILIQFITDGTKLKCLRVFCRKVNSTVSKEILKSRKISHPGMFLAAVKFIKSSINLIFSSIVLPLTNPVQLITFNQFRKDFNFDMICGNLWLQFYNHCTLSKVIGPQFLIRLGSASFFEISLTNPSSLRH